MSALDISPVSIRDAAEQWTGQWADDTTNNTVTLRGSWKRKNKIMHQNQTIEWRTDAHAINRKFKLHRGLLKVAAGKEVGSEDNDTYRDRATMQCATMKRATIQVHARRAIK